MKLTTNDLKIISNFMKKEYVDMGLGYHRLLEAFLEYYKMEEKK